MVPGHMHRCHHATCCCAVQKPTKHWLNGACAHVAEVEDEGVAQVVVGRPVEALLPCSQQQPRSRSITRQAWHNHSAATPLQGGQMAV